MKYYRSCTNLVKNSHIDDARDQLAYFSTKVNPPAQKLLDLIETKALRVDVDLFGETGKLYDIHYHTADAATTKESLETYLRSTMTGDEFDVKCYNFGSGCTQKLTLREIKLLVSPAFYEIYSKPRPVKSGLDLEVDNYEAVFRNIKTKDDKFGDIYHATMCPYCLKFEERGDGCSVMTHENPKGLSKDHAPYCAQGRAVPELITKYKTLAAGLADGYYRLEFCVECGRPSSGHQHFNLDLQSFAPIPKKADPLNPGRFIDDYGVCPGGGRPEMIARMLAVRDVYRRRNLRDVKTERHVAALEAEKAPLNPVLMARAKALWAAAQPGIQWLQARKQASEEAKAAAGAAGATPVQQSLAGNKAGDAYAAANPKPADISWDMPVPKTKKYNDPLYLADDAANNVSYAQWLNGPEAQQPEQQQQQQQQQLGPVPDIPANMEQREWNQKIIIRIQNALWPGLAEEYLEKLQNLLDIARFEQADIPEGQPGLIDVNLVNALAILTIVTHEEYWRSNLFRGIVLGGRRVLNAIDPDLGPLYQDVVTELKSELEGMQYPVQPVQGAVGGTRSSFRRRRGKPLKKSRQTRRN
jgi:hypothetical protein